MCDKHISRTEEGSLFLVLEVGSKWGVSGSEEKKRRGKMFITLKRWQLICQLSVLTVFGVP